MTSAKNLRIGLLSPVDLDPRDSQDYLSTMALELLFETPFAVPEAGKPPVPVIMREPLRRTSSAEYRGHIRNDVRFSDGSELTPAQLVASFEGSPALAREGNFRFEGDEIVFSLHRPNASFELFMTQRFCAVTRPGTGGSLLGTGPFVLSPESTRERVHFVRNPYYRKDIEVEEVELVVYPPTADAEPTALLDALQSGEVDITNALTRQDLRKIKGLRTWFEPGNSTAILFFNTQRQFFADSRVRRACALAVDRTELARILYPDNPLAFRASGLLPKSLDQWRDRLYPSPDRARRLLAESGLEPPRPLTMAVIWCPRPYLPQPQRAAEFIARQLGAIGLDVEVEVSADLESYISLVRKGSYDLFLSGWVADTPDPVDFLESTLLSSLVPEPGGVVANSSNLSRWQDARTDAALERYRQIGPAEAREEIIDILNDEVPIFPLLYGSVAGAYSWRVSRCDLSALGVPRVAEIRFR